MGMYLGPKEKYVDGVDCSKDVVLVKQEFLEESDINVIIGRFVRGGGISYVNKVAPMFADVSNVGDYASCLRMVMEAEEAFMMLPANLRARFGNDPAQVLAFLRDERNRDEAVALGLVVPPAPVVAAVPASPVVVPGAK